MFGDGGVELGRRDEHEKSRWAMVKGRWGHRCNQHYYAVSGSNDYQAFERQYTASLLVNGYRS